MKQTWDYNNKGFVDHSGYKIIIPKEEPKQETLEEAAEKWYDSTEENIGYPKIKAFKDGAKWQQEQYTIEEQCVGHTIDELDKEYIKGFNEGSAYQQERMYSEEDMKNAFLDGWQLRDGDLPFTKAKNKWFKEFKKEII